MYVYIWTPHMITLPLLCRESYNHDFELVSYRRGKWVSLRQHQHYLGKSDSHSSRVVTVHHKYDNSWRMQGDPTYYCDKE